MRPLLIVLCLSPVVRRPSPLHAQDAEIRLARSAAPAEVSAKATVLWKPHLMLYYPHMRATDLGLEKPGALVSFLNEGGARSAIVIPAGDFVQPAPATP